MALKSLPEEFQFLAKEKVWPELRAFVSAVEARFSALEEQGSTFDEEVAKFEALGVAAVNEAIAPLVNQAIERLTSIAKLFEAQSPTEHTISTGAKEFLIPGDERLTFVATPFLAIYANDSDPVAGLICTLESFDPITGELRVVVTEVEGSGTYDDWTVRVAAPSVAGGASQSYVDSAISAAGASLSAAVAAELSSQITALRNELRGGVVTSLNTLQKLAAAIGNDASFSASVTNALNTKVSATSPALAGTPTAPSAGGTVSTNQIATMAAVQAALTAFLSKAPADKGTKSSGSWQCNPSGGPIQFIKNAGAHTLLAPNETGAVMLFVENIAGAGAITFSGFEKALSGGDSLTTTVGHKFLIQIQSIIVSGGISVQSYMVKALQ